MSTYDKKIENLNPILKRIRIQNNTSFYKLSVIGCVISRQLHESDHMVAYLEQHREQRFDRFVKVFFVQILCW